MSPSNYLLSIFYWFLMLTILYICVFRVQSPMNNFRHLTTIEIEKQSINNQRGLFDLFQSPRTRFQSAPNLEPFDDWKLNITRFWLISRREKIQKFPNENKYHTRLKDGGRTNWNMVRACLADRRRREFTLENCHTDSRGGLWCFLDFKPQIMIDVTPMGFSLYPLFTILSGSN